MNSTEPSRLEGASAATAPPTKRFWTARGGVSWREGGRPGLGARLGQRLRERRSLSPEKSCLLLPITYRGPRGVPGADPSLSSQTIRGTSEELASQ